MFLQEHSQVLRLRFLPTTARIATMGMLLQQLVTQLGFPLLLFASYFPARDGGQSALASPLRLPARKRKQCKYVPAGTLDLFCTQIR